MDPLSINAMIAWNGKIPVGNISGLGREIYGSSTLRDSFMLRVSMALGNFTHFSGSLEQLSFVVFCDAVQVAESPRAVS